MSNAGKSVTAVVAGFFAVVVLSIGTDLMMHQFGIFPGLSKPMSHRLFLLAVSYRALISVFGCYLAAKLAPSRPMKHAMWLGTIGIIFALIGVGVSRSRPELGPLWYPTALVVIALPCAWIGGKLREIQVRAVE